MQQPVVFGKNPVKFLLILWNLSDSHASIGKDGKLQELHKLPGIRAQLVISNDNWQEWNFQRFIENLPKWTEGNPVVSRHKQISFQPQKERILQRSQRQCIKNQTSTNGKE